MATMGDGSAFLLVTVSGPGQNKEFILYPGENVIGREEGDVLLDFDPNVSRRHCSLKIPSLDIELADLGSTNGTAVNGITVSPDNPVKIKPGDTLKIGGGEYRIVTKLGAAKAEHHAVDALSKGATELGGQLKRGAQAAAAFGSKQAEAAAPHLQKAAQKARQQAGAFAEQSRLATMTGVKPLYLWLFAVALLIASMLIPPILKWPIAIYATGEVHAEESTSAGGSLGILPVLPGTDENLHAYGGFQYSSQFIPFNKDYDVPASLSAAVLAAGPLLITGSPIAVAGTGSISEQDYGAFGAQLYLNQPMLWLYFGGVLVVLLLMADFLIGDQWAMQKLLVTTLGVWAIYSLVIGSLASFGLRAAVISAYAEGATLYPSFSGVLQAPVRIAVIGLVYWGCSAGIRKLRTKSTS